MQERFINRGHFSCIAEMYWECDLNTIYEGENVGQYISRMKKLIDLINVQFGGNEEVDFSDIEESIANGTTMRGLIMNAIGLQAVRSSEVCTIDERTLTEEDRESILEDGEKI